MKNNNHTNTKINAELSANDQEIKQYWRYAQFCAERSQSNPTRFSLAARQLYIKITQNLPANFGAEDIGEEYNRLENCFKKSTLQRASAKSIVELTLAFHDSINHYNETKKQNECFIGTTSSAFLLQHAFSMDNDSVKKLYKNITKPSNKAMKSVSRYINTTQNDKTLYANWKTCSYRRFKFRSISLHLLDWKIKQYSKIMKKSGNDELKLEKTLLMKQAVNSWINKKNKRKYINRDSRISSAMTLLADLNNKTTKLEKKVYINKDPVVNAKTVCKTSSVFMLGALLSATLLHTPIGFTLLSHMAGKSLLAGSLTSYAMSRISGFFKRKKAEPQPLSSTPYPRLD